jgi:hypothetical protein
MPPTLPSLFRRFVTAPARRAPGSVLRRLAIACVAAACHREPPPVAPGESIPPPPEVALGTMDAECDALLAALATYRACPHLDGDERWTVDAWTERAQQDFAAGKKAKPEPNAQRAIAAACHKAISSVAAATERCHAGPRPRP